MSDASQTDRRALLLAHLDSVYALAQAVAPDAERAARLVEDTYVQALATLPPGRPPEDDKRRLLHLMMQVHREQAAFPEPTAEAGAEPPAKAMHAFRRRLAEEIADSALPAVFAALPEAQRLILLLCEVEDFPCSDAAFVLDLDAEAACRRLEQARAAVLAALHEGASAHQRRLMESGLPEDWLRHALRRTAAAAFRPAPPSLHPSITKAAEARPPSPPEAPPLEPPPPEPPRLSLPEERLADALPRPAAFGARLGRFALALLLVTAIGLIGYFASRSFERPAETNAVTLSVQKADDVSLTFRTGSPEQAEEFVQGRLGWRLTLPSIDEATLIGVGIREPASGVAVPVFLYEDAGGAATPPIALYVYSYALFDRYRDRIQLEPGILRQIQEEQRFDLHDLGERQVLVWRHRDDIYLAVTSGDAEALRQRIVFPS